MSGAVTSRIATWAIRRALLTELGFAFLVATFGFGGALAEERWYHFVLPLLHFPGITILDSAGLCCGYVNSLVISDEWIGRYGGLTLVGAPILFAANTLGLFAFFAITRAGWLLIATSRTSAIQKRAG